MIFRISLLAAVIATLAFSPMVNYKHTHAPAVASAAVSLTGGEAAPQTLAGNSSFYSFRHDLRKCASPRCGGFFVKLVNQSRTRCADNRLQSECYVANIDWGGQTEPDNDHGLLRGTIRRRGEFGLLRVSEIWS